MSALVTLDGLCALAGAALWGMAVQISLEAGRPKRWGSALFWACLGTSMGLGHRLPDRVNGYLLMAAVLLVALRQVATGRSQETPREEREARASRLGNRLFIPVLTFPACAIAGSLFLGKVHLGSLALLEPNRVSLIATCLGAFIALAVAIPLTRTPLRTPFEGGSHILQTVGWTLILPQLLAALGGLFLDAGVGKVIASGVGAVVPPGSAFAAVAAYCVGMALFTILLGNAFAAFPVITGGIGLPLIVQGHGGNPAIMAALGMLAGYCGTLVTPMAANFNVVPVLLLDIKDPHAVIKAQIPIALVVFLANLLLMYGLVYHVR